MALTRDAMFWDAFTAHADKAVAAAKEIEVMLGDLGNAEKYAKTIADLESQADQITHDVIKALHQTWITPLDREEIHALISRQDDVLDYIEAASERIMLYELTSPREEAKEMAHMLVACTAEIAVLVSALRSIKDADALLTRCRAIAKIEEECDSVFRRGLARLFKEKGDPLDVMKWRDIFESLENATDRAQDVADIIEGIVLEHA